MEYLIWWTSQEEAEKAWEHQETFLAAGFPDYIEREFKSRMGRAGRGRLWVADEIPIKEIDWDEKKPAARLASQRAGIVIRAEDKDFVFDAPGFLTDLKLDFIND